MFPSKSVIGLFALSVACMVPEVRAGGEGHGFHANHAAVFLGATLHDGHAVPTVGLDYERYLNPHVGVVALAELLIDDHLAEIAALGLAYHPIAPVKLAALAGMEFADGHNAFLARGTLEYAFHLGAMGVSPSVSVDYMDSEVIFVAGLALGVGF